MAARKKKDAIVLADPANLEIALAPQRAEAEVALQSITKLDLSTQAKRDKAGLVLADIRGRIQGLEELRMSVTKPILEAKRKVDSLFKPIREYWESCDKALAAKLAASSYEAEEAQRKALAIVAETAGNTDHAILTVAHDTPRTPDGLSEVEKWEWAVEDESEVPREFLCLDATKISVYVRQNKGDAQIPGIRVFSTKQYRKSNASTRG